MRKLAKKQTGGPSFKNPVKATKDSSKYYSGEEKYYKEAGKNLMSKFKSNRPTNVADSLAAKAAENKKRQANKGKPGYDSNGFINKKFLSSQDNPKGDFKKMGGSTKTKKK